MAEVRRVAKAARGEPHLDALPPFAGTKALRPVRPGRVRQDARGQAREERVREGEPAPGGLHRPPVQPRPPAAARPHPGGQHRPDEGGRALRLPSWLPLLDLRQLVDPARHQPGAGRQGSGGPPAGAHDRRLPQDRQERAGAAVQAGAPGDHRGDRHGDGHRDRQAREDEDLPGRDAGLARQAHLGRGRPPADRRPGGPQRGAQLRPSR